MVSKKFILLPIALVCTIFMKSATALDLVYCDFTSNQTNPSDATGRLSWTRVSNGTFSGAHLTGQLNTGFTSQNPQDYSFCAKDPSGNVFKDMSREIDDALKITNPPGTGPFNCDFSGLDVDTLSGMIMEISMKQADGKNATIGRAQIQPTQDSLSPQSSQPVQGSQPPQSSQPAQDSQPAQSSQLTQ
ncbi:hypothetical protein C2G38_2120035 [Gigaspora rosea]|uniref:AA1-like domain-containing protein n=1 Tax=Gigaspora rosea TaxID=44941 RepID=A0A397U6K6_9GLOM|nr:hypothetical protein C2G38_2120035 [Gigaspora rosea]